jgi:hypothetical protein
MMKKVALLCAIVMLVSVVPAFAATSDTPIKKQTKLQQKLKIQDGTGNATATGDQTQTQSQLKKQLKTQDGTCTGDQTQDQTQTKLQKQLKVGTCTAT